MKLVSACGIGRKPSTLLLGNTKDFVPCGLGSTGPESQKTSAAPNDVELPRKSPPPGRLGSPTFVTPSLGRLFQVTPDSDQELSGTKIAQWSGSPSCAHPAREVVLRRMSVIVAPAGMDDRLNRMSVYDVP